MRNLVHGRFQRADDELACWTAGICLVVSAALLIVGMVFLNRTSDSARLTLTTVEVFHEWGALAGILRDTTAYDPRFNPPSVAHALFETSVMGSLSGVQDLFYRGLLTKAELENRSAYYNQTTGFFLYPSAVDPALMAAMALEYIQRAAQMGIQAVAPLPLLDRDPRLLPRLLAVSGCSFPSAVPGSSPINRSPGCQCIGNAYVDFVSATANMTTNVTAEERDAGGDSLLRCLDKRVTWRTWGLERDYSVSPLALAVYASGIFFLMCLAFLLSFNHEMIFGGISWSPDKKNLAIKFLLAAFSGGLVVFLVYDGWRRNLFQLVGIAIALAHLVFSAHSPLNYAGRQQQNQAEARIAHPLLVCFWLNVPLIIPAIVTAQASTSYLRDSYALLVVAIASFALGLGMQVRLIIFCVCVYFIHAYLACGFAAPVLAGVARAGGDRQAGAHPAAARGLRSLRRARAPHLLGVLLECGGGLHHEPPDPRHHFPGLSPVPLRPAVV